MGPFVGPISWNIPIPNTFHHLQELQKPSQRDPKPGAPEAPPTKRPEHMGTSKVVPSGTRGTGTWDVTEIPKQLDANFEKLDSSNSVRPTMLGEGCEGFGKWWKFCVWKRWLLWSKNMCFSILNFRMVFG